VADDLIGTARRLAKASPQRPRQADLKRGISTAYYALFHMLAGECADLLLGTGQARGTPAWVQVYRALEHGIAKNACKNAPTRGFPQGILNFADTFVTMQEERHRADYDPEARYGRPEVLNRVTDCEQAIIAFRAETRNHRRAFAVWVLLQKRR